MKKSEWFVYNCIMNRANAIEMAVFRVIENSVIPFNPEGKKWKNVLKQFPDKAKAVLDYHKNPDWWKRVKKACNRSIRISNERKRILHDEKMEIKHQINQKKKKKKRKKN
jgi:antitoxin component of RelBE/YafQ-DinJ toxin-antitoxin module